MIRSCGQASSFKEQMSRSIQHIGSRRLLVLPELKLFRIVVVKFGRVDIVVFGNCDRHESMTGHVFLVLQEGEPDCEVDCNVVRRLGLSVDVNIESCVDVTSENDASISLYVIGTSRSQLSAVYQRSTCVSSTELLLVLASRP